MRAIEKEMLEAIRNGKNFQKSNTAVIHYNNVAYIYLHGNNIARIYSEYKREFSNAGWRTATTKSRLNALGAGIYQRDFEWYNADGNRFVNAF